MKRRGAMETYLMSLHDCLTKQGKRGIVNGQEILREKKVWKVKVTHALKG